MKMKMKMPKVSACEATECAYNKDSQCHALAINVGDGSHPRCDTFAMSSSEAGDSSAVAQVGACKVDACKFNKSLECSAPSIRVAHHKAKCADCATFSPK
jgi:hypothetical protein